MIPVDNIVVPVFLPVRESVPKEKLKGLQESISNHGLMYPVKVRAGLDGTFELKDGYLRLCCFKNLRWKEIPAEVSETSDEEVVVESLITNKDRLDEDPITVAKKLEVLVNNFNWTQEKLAQELGMDQTSISNHIRLLRLPEEIQHHLLVNNISFHHALLLLSLDNPDLQKKLAEEVVKHGLSVADLQRRVWDFKAMPHLHAVPVGPLGGKVPEVPRVFTAHCSNPRCLKGLYEDEISTVDGQAYCLEHAPDAHVALLRRQRKETEAEEKLVSAASLDTMEMKKARMQPGKSAFEERVVNRFRQFIATLGFNVKTDEQFPVIVTVPDAYVSGLEALAYIDGPPHLRPKQADKDERSRGLLEKHHPELNIKGFPFKADTQEEEDRVFSELCKWAEGLKEELGKGATSKEEVTLPGASDNKEESE
jgi:ParB/RepB/Spo0J family partition protein